eukprot:Nitzschia sp. Nitz4//scaffold56_size114212//30547//37556//NITZ4_003939-RA/size114212-augustus-gene-0.81-mRNA-1//-1//CDS//3329554673//8155//frame0
MSWPNTSNNNAASSEETPLQSNDSQDYLSTLNDGTEEAELNLLSNLEAQTRTISFADDGFKPAVPGERAPLNVGSVGTALQEEEPRAPAGKPKLTFKGMAKKVQRMNRMKKALQGGRRARNILESLDGSVSDMQNDSHQVVDFSKDIFSMNDNSASDLGRLQYTMFGGGNSDQDLKEQDQETTASDAPSEKAPLLQKQRSVGSSIAHIKEKLRRAHDGHPTFCQRCADVFHPVRVCTRLWDWLSGSTLVIAIPMFILSWCLYYEWGNPELDFLPGNEFLSWWLNFAGRQLLLLELARLSQYILIDICTMSSRMVVKWLGPWVTIFCLQSKGWPFLFTFWGFYDMLLLHGDNKFQRHWLYWTNIEMFQLTEQGGFIMNSELYLRVLIAMVLVGIATTLKRTVLTLYFGKRSFENYKPKLEQLLSEMIVITEMAELATEADILSGRDFGPQKAKDKKKPQISARWTNLRPLNNSSGHSEDDDDASVDDDKVPNEDEPKRQMPRPSTSDGRMSMIRSDSNLSGIIRMKDLLDRWDEPVNKLDKRTDSTVKDILRFRQALTFMDLENPFGEAFGPASTRDELIDSSEKLYARLLTLSNGEDILPYSVLMVLTENKDGTIDKKMKKNIKNLFRADANKNISVLSFVQSCDYVYRQLRYFRASVGNASVIDRVLESLINTIYMFGLGLLVLALLNLNPWPLVVSLSTLLVSFAFAIGPTVAKAIEGVLLIVGSRPYDIGDRIIIANSAGSPVQTISQSWFVEDITLTRTTLRNGGTNEVATINNGAIATSRITNCARSKNATILLDLRFDVSFHQGDNAKEFEDMVKDYVREHPDIWESVLFFCCNGINSDERYTSYTLGLRSRRSWQPSARVLTEKGLLYQYCSQASQTLAERLMKWPKIHKNISADGENPKKGQDYRSRNTEDAELAILSNLEAQGMKTTTTADGFRPAIPGERAPLNVGSLGHALHDPENCSSPGTPKKTFKEMAQKVMTAQAASSLANGGRRAHNILSKMERRSSRALDGRDVVDFRTDVFAISEEPSKDLEKFPFDVWVDESTDSDFEPESENADDVPPSESHPLLGNKKSPTTRATKRDKVLERLRTANPQAHLSCWTRFLSAINPVNVLSSLLWVFLNSSLLFALLFLALSWVLFYHMGNPELDFLPGNENLSWWMNFACRQLVLLELARLTQYILIDIFAMSSRLVVKILGPWVTIFCLQSKGWPFLLTWWGFYDLVFLHGNNNFQRRWLFWTDVEMFQLTEEGGLIMNSELYLRVLVAMVIVGILTTIKRTILTLYFGKRSFENYKPKLEQLLSEMIVVTELAELAAEADILTGQPPEGGNLQGKRKGPLHARWASLQFQTSVTEEDSPELDLASPPQGHAKRGLSPDRFSDDRSRSSASNLSGLIRIKNQLDRWEEPVNKQDKRDDSTVKDILRFRQALTYMDLEHPFGEAFGPASNRDELIQSAERLYERLLKLDPDAEVLPYSVLMVLAENKDGTTDHAMKKSIKNIFRADANKQIALLPFVQSCDFVYRQLRYFRASVGNSSVIDRVLESIINTAYMFGLTMLVLVLLNLNPWPLVVSTSTLLVSFAFAIGPTVAKAIEGILLIVGARPYDIGDRIIIADTAGSLIQTVGQSWFVEDISLTRTTLRCGPTNEVASINNAAIAMARITNCARSKNAITMMQIRFDLRFHEGDNVTRFESRIEDYIQKHPDIWDSLAYFRCDDIDTDRKCTTYVLAVRSRRTWQPAARVLTERGRLLKYCNEVAQGFGMAYLSPDQRYQMYIAGQNNAVQDDEPNLAHPATWFGVSNEDIMEGNTDGPVIAPESVMPE